MTFGDAKAPYQYSLKNRQNQEIKIISTIHRVKIDIFPDLWRKKLISVVSEYLHDKDEQVPGNPLDMKFVEAADVTRCKEIKFS